MLFSNRPQSAYGKAPAHEVICQLRFPAILSINGGAPADFQEVIRSEFPQYACRQETPAPAPAAPGGVRPPQQPPINNYSFLSADGLWKLNLTQGFIALSTLRYAGWEEFAHRLDKPLAAFIRLYQPAYFERVGLRYVNIISRAKLGLTDCPWAELIAPAYCGPLAEEDVAEGSMVTCSTDFMVKPDSSCLAKIHAGPGQVKSNAPNASQDPESKFILDLDLSMGGQVSCALSAGALETLHGHAIRLFEGAITDTLRQAME